WVSFTVLIKLNYPVCQFSVFHFPVWKLLSLQLLLFLLFQFSLLVLVPRILHYVTFHLLVFPYHLPLILLYFLVALPPAGHLFLFFRLHYHLLNYGRNDYRTSQFRKLHPHNFYNVSFWFSPS